VIEAGHDVQLVATNDWPDCEWPFGSITHLRSKSPIEFASELERMRAQFPFDVLFSLERVWSCDVYRAGDGVHRAWLERRRKFEMPLKRFVRSLSSKHQDLLRLEQSLFSGSNAKRVIAGSQMVKDEIINLYGYPADKIDIVRNGVPLKKFRFDPELREKSREELNLKPDQIALLFAGSGWERKGLLFAIEAAALAGIARCGCSLPVAEMQGSTRRGASGFGAKRRCNFSVKLRTCCVFTLLPTFLSCLHLRSIFQCLSGSARLRFARDHHAFQRF
jgi:Glycosyltransferase